MSQKEIDRKIAVIFATDVVGYSKHMEKDEDETLKSFRACRKILEKLFEEHGGRIFNTAGDSVLAEFPSAVSAVVCASEFQSLVKERNYNNQSHIKMEFRIGINMGDVVKEEGNLYGDGVNIAARLESFAQPNGICLSKSVYELVNKKTKFLFNDLGEQKVKENQFHAFDVLLDPSQKRTIKTKSKSYMPIFAAIAAVVLISIGGFLYLMGQQSGSQKTSIELEQPKEKVLGRTLLIAPFQNKSGSKEFDYIAEGISDHLMSSLTSNVLLNIIPKLQSYRIVDKDLSFKEIIDTYNVSYLLNGTTLISNEKFRINLELVDAHQEKIIWTVNKEYSVNDIFSAQDNIELIVLKSLQNNLTMGNVLSETFANSFDNREDYKKVLNIRFLRHSDNFSISKDNELPYKELLAINPNNAMLNYLFAKSIYTKLINFKSVDRKKDYKAMEEALKTAIKLEPNSSMPYALLALVNEGGALMNFDLEKGLEQQRQSATNYVKKGLELGPNNMETLFYSGMFFQIVGKSSNAISLFERAIKLAPFGPEAIRVNLISAYLVKFDFETAEKIAKSMIKQGDRRSIFIGSMFLAYIKAKTNRVEEAKIDFKKILDINKYSKKEAVFQIRRYGAGSYTWYTQEFGTVMEGL